MTSNTLTRKLSKKKSKDSISGRSVQRKPLHLFKRTGFGLDGYAEMENGQITISLRSSMPMDITFNYVKAAYDLSHRGYTKTEVTQTDNANHVYTLYNSNKPIFSFRKGAEGYVIQPHEGTSLEGLMDVITGT